MPSSTYKLAFEQPIYKLEEQIAKLDQTEPMTAEVRDAIRALKRELADTTRRIYGGLDPWETVQVARHPDRPMLTDYLNLLFDEFVELHGDKFFGDDRALRTELMSNNAAYYERYLRPDRLVWNTLEIAQHA